MPPASLAGCAIKLRTLLHPTVGIETGDEHDVPNLRQIPGRDRARGRLMMTAPASALIAAAAFWPRWWAALALFRLATGCAWLARRVAPAG